MPSSKNKLSSTQKINNKRQVKSKSDQLLEKRIKQQEENRKILEDRKAQRALEREQKMVKSFTSVDNLFALGAYSSLLFDVYVLYLAISSRGNLLIVASFFVSILISAGLFYTSRVLSQKDKRAVTYYSIILLITMIFTFALRSISGSPVFLTKDIVSYLLPLALLFEMYRLKTGGFLT
jgi:hypothetical protein